MKKFHHSIYLLPKSLCLLLVLLLVTSFAFAQKIHLTGAQIPSFDASLSNQFSEYQVFQINTRVLESDLQQEDNFQLDLQLGGQNQFKINLTPSQIISPNYREIIGSENGPVVLPKRKNIAFTGYIQGTEFESKLTLDNGWVMGFITLPNGEKLYIEPLGNLQSRTTSDQYIVYSGNAVLNNSNGSCGALEASSRAPIHENQFNDPTKDPIQLTNTNCKEVDFSVASSFDMINGFHNSPQLVMNHIISITNMMQTYFEFSSIEYLLNDNYVSESETADPFDGAIGPSTDDLLPGFQSWAQNSGIFSEHDVAQVWTARNITGCGSNFGLIGCAYINVICNNFRYNICEDWRPTDIQALAVLSAHELGHNWNCVHEDIGDAPFNIMNAFINPSAIGFGPNSMAKIINTANNSDCLSSCDGPPDPPIANCPAQSEFPFQEWIEDVTIGNLSNLGSGKFIDFSNAGYSDFTDLESAPNDRADLVEFTLNAGFSGANPGDFWTGFIDYNQNNVFDLPEEEVIRSQGTSINGSFSIPTDALNGTALLRVILSKNGFSGPCENPAFGEVEDYLIEIDGTVITTPNNDPDLTIGNLIVSDQGETETIVGYSVDFSNVGLSTTGAFSLGVFLSPNNQLDANDLLVGEIPTGNFTPGLTVTDVPGSFNLEGVAIGDYFLFFKIDQDEVVTESDETNNVLVRNFTVTSDNTGDEIDLELSMTASVSEPDRFSNSRITLTLFNNSSNQATNIVSRFNFSSDYVFAGDGSVSTTGGGTFSIGSGNWSIPSLSGGQTAMVSFDLFTLSDDFNPCAEVASVDQQDVDSTPGNGQCPNAFEDDEANLNTISPPEETIDLVLESLNFPASGISGTQGTGEILISRLGISTEQFIISLEIFLSENGQLDDDAIPIGSSPVTSNTPFSNNTIVIVSDFLQVSPGDYTLIAVIDRNNEIMETNENNNIASIPFTVEDEEIIDCSEVIGGDEILCSQNIGNLTRLFIREGNEYFTADIAMDGNVLATSPNTTPLVYDSTLIQDGILTHKLSNGTILFSGPIPTAALDFIPEPLAATRLSNGEYLIAGNVELDFSNTPPFFEFETRVLKLDVNLTTILSQRAIPDNITFPGNNIRGKKVEALFALPNREAMIIYTIFNETFVNDPNILFRKLDTDLNAFGTITYLDTRLNSVTETPCGDLLIDATLLQVGQKGSTIADQQIRISRDGSTVSSFWERGVSRQDLVEPIQFANFSQNQDPNLFLSYSSFESVPVTELIGNLPQSNGDNTQIVFPFLDFTYGTRNGNTAFLYANINGEINVITECDPPVSEGVDIEVTLEVSNETPELFTNIGYQVTVQNLGTETATGVVVDFDYGPQDNSSPLALVNNPNPDYNDWDGIWTIETLAPGEARTFNLEVFVLAAASPTTTLFAELSELNESDIDSSNDISEATIIINDGATVNEVANSTNAFLRRPDLSLDNLFPNPALDKVTLAINNQKETNQVPLQIFDAFGKNIFNKEILLEKGMNFLTINTTEFSEGVYLVVLPNGSHQNLVKRFIKMR